MELQHEHRKGMSDGPPIEIAPGLYQLTIPMPFKLNHVHLYLLEADEGFILIDTGVNTSESFAGLKRKMDDLGLDLSAITQIVITHFHSDHCGQAARIRELSKAQIVMGATERSTLDRVQANPNEERAEQFLRHGLPPEQAMQYADVLPYLKSLSLPFDVDLRVGHGQTLLAKRRRLEAFITPGHTPGHVCLFLPEEKIMFSGDHILQKITPNIGFHSYSGPNPLGDYLHSLQSTRTLGATLLLPSHGPIVEDPEARIHELLQHHDRRLQACLDTLGPSPTTAYDVSLKVFGTSLSYFERWLALGETLSHLEHLVHEGQVTSTDEEGCVSYTRA
ncbi:MAG: MBL fold metallo-hydrolase [Nitrospinae bacterium]|nr:MBL fold metallo-hydrolase [Nitrospinota bacterium]